MADGLGSRLDLSEASHYSYASTGSEKERAFVIIAGEEADVTTEMGKYELIPDTYMLGQNIPNPFNPVTSIPIILGEDAFVTLSVYNIRGEEVSRILDHQSMTKGHHNSIWMGTDARGMKVPTGVYLYRLVAADNLGRMLYQHTRKMIMVK
jgi:flagellar hook assembly protein FlgD